MGYLPAIILYSSSGLLHLTFYLSKPFDILSSVSGRTRLVFVVKVEDVVWFIHLFLCGDLRQECFNLVIDKAF